jgi:hypothetical protein
MSQARVDVYFYSFEHTVDAVTPGRAFHGLETNLVFGNNFGPSTHCGRPRPVSDDQRVLGTFCRYWEPGRSGCRALAYIPRGSIPDSLGSLCRSGRCHH